MSLQTTIYQPRVTRNQANVLKELRRNLGAFQREMDHQTHWIKALTSYWGQRVEHISSEGVASDALVRFLLSKDEQTRAGMPSVLTLFEFKHQAKKQSLPLCAKALLQCLIYRRKYISSSEQSRQELGSELSVFLVVTEKRAWWFPVREVEQFESAVLDWTCQPSNAFQKNKDAYEKITAAFGKKGPLYAYYSNTVDLSDDVFSLESMRQRIIACARSQRFRAPVDSGNAHLWLSKFRDYVIGDESALEPSFGPPPAGSSEEVKRKLKDWQKKLREWESTVRRQIQAFVACVGCSGESSTTFNELYQLRGGKHYILISRANSDDLASIQILSKGRLASFVNSIRRVDSERRKAIIRDADQLLGSDNLSRLYRGDFYTPLVWVDHAQSLLDEHLPEWESGYIWDASCGTGNLTGGRKLPRLVQTTLFEEDVVLLNQRGTNPERLAREQLDFLKKLGAPATSWSDEFANRKNAPLVFFNNPPWKTPATLDSNGKKARAVKASETGVKVAMGKAKEGRQYHSGKSKAAGFRADNLYFQFLFKITNLASLWNDGGGDIYNAIFLPTNAFCGSQNYKFQKYYFDHWEFVDGFVFPHSDFKGTSGTEESVCFTLWKFGAKTTSRSLALPLLKHKKGVVTSLGHVSTFFSEPEGLLNMWWKEGIPSNPKTVPCLPLSSAMGVSKSIEKGVRTLPKDAFGYFVCSTDAVKQNAQQVYLLASARLNGHGAPLVPTSSLHSPHWGLLKAFAAFFSRRAILPSSSMWKVWHYDYRKPNLTAGNMDSFVKWATNCAVFACFDKKSSQASMRKSQDVPLDMLNHLFWESPRFMKKLAQTHGFDKMLYDLDGNGASRRLRELLKSNKKVLSKEAKDVLVRARHLLETTFPHRLKSPPEYFLHCWDAGFYQLQKLVGMDDDELGDAKKKLIAEFEQLHGSVKTLRDKLLPGIFDFGFLPRDILLHLKKGQGGENDSADEYGGKHWSPAKIPFTSNHQSLFQVPGGVDEFLKSDLPAFERLEVPGDNSCFFTSGAIGLKRSGLSDMRQDLVEWMRLNWKTHDVLQSAIVTDRYHPGEQYFNWLEQPSSWGGDPERIALSLKEGVILKVVEPIDAEQEPQSCHISCYPEQEDPAADGENIIWMAYNGVNHFDPLIRRTKDSRSAAQQRLKELERELDDWAKAVELSLRPEEAQPGVDEKEKSSKDGKASKKPKVKSAYEIFKKAKMPSIAEAIPKFNYSQRSKEAKRMWKAASVEEKKQYEAKHTHMSRVQTVTQESPTKRDRESREIAKSDEKKPKIAAAGGESPPRPGALSLGKGHASDTPKEGKGKVVKRDREDALDSRVTITEHDAKKKNEEGKKGKKTHSPSATLGTYPASLGLE